MKTIIENLPLITALGALVAFIIGLFKWIAVRKREERNYRYEQYNRVFEKIGGRTSEGKFYPNTIQAMAVYEISNFQEYREITLPIIEYYLEQTKTANDNELFRASLIYTKKRLSK